MRVKLIAAVLGLAFSTSAAAWGRDGHETVGYVAAAAIKGTVAEREVGKLLRNGETLATAAEWPDCAKGYCDAPLTTEMQEFNTDNKHNHAYHYTDVPFQKKAYEKNAIGAAPDDVVHILEDAILVLQDKPPQNPEHKLTKREALFILAHMVGDIHQPLHVGAAYIDEHLALVDPKSQANAKATFSEGGNWLCVGASGLHGLWDTDYVKGAMNNAGVTSSSDFASSLRAKPGVGPTAGSPLAWPTAWAMESLQLAAKGLKNIQVKEKRKQDTRHGCGMPDTAQPVADNMWSIVLPPAYEQQAVDLIPGRLHAAGLHLAALLQAIWPS